MESDWFAKDESVDARIRQHFEHRESLEDQAFAVTLIGQLRNDVLGRISPEDELALLHGPMGSF